MGHTVSFSSAKWMRDTDGIWLCLRAENERSAVQFVAEMKQGKRYDAELKEHRENRSLDANAYCWVLLDKLASLLNTTKTELYLRYIKSVGVFKDWTLTEEEAKTFCVAWSMIGTGWPTEAVDFDSDGDRKTIRAYYGSSTYNTKQMSRLIDAIVADCKEQGIETLTPRELDAMKERWKCTK